MLTTGLILKIFFTTTIVWVVLTGTVYLIFRNRSKKTFSFVFNFFILGSGFMVLLGRKGFRLTLIYLIPFLLVYLTGIGILFTSFGSERLSLIKNASQIIQLLLYIICYIHLYKVSKNIPSEIG